MDVLLIPVGGFFTIDAAAAKQTAEALDPVAVIPMHYKTEVNASWPITPVDPFLDLMGASESERAPLQILRITQEDLSEQPRLAVMAVVQAR